MAHLDKHKILSDDQHGFRKNRSCETQLIVTLNDLAKGLNSKQQIDAVLLDFSKAFDKSTPPSPSPQATVLWFLW